MARKIATVPLVIRMIAVPKISLTPIVPWKTVDSHTNAMIIWK